MGEALGLGLIPSKDEEIKEIGSQGQGLWSPGWGTTHLSLDIPDIFILPSHEFLKPEPQNPGL